VRSGLLGINGFILDTVRYMKDSFERSNKTEEDKDRILNIEDSLKVDWMYWLYSPPCFQKLESLLK